MKNSPKKSLTPKQKKSYSKKSGIMVHCSRPTGSNPDNFINPLYIAAND